MTRSRNIRLYRACERCRQRKLKCDPTRSPDGSKSPCLECIRAGEECVLAGSRRGGDFSKFRRSAKKQKMDSASTPNRDDANELEFPQHSECEKGSEDPIYAELTNPGDALQILARLAANDPKRSQQDTNPRTWSPPHSDSCNNEAKPSENFIKRVQTPTLQRPLSETETLVIGILGTDTARSLLNHYADNYHPFCPLAPKSVLATNDVRRTAIKEPMLLTVILTIASKDETAYQEIHQQCWHYLKKHLLDVLLAVPSTLNVGTVESLLLLAEWVPYLQLETGSYPKLFPGNLSAVEDNMAWSLIGQAVRHSYLLRLDKASFREKVRGESKDIVNRKQLAWIFVYIADRQISVRMGQSFWSRGPSLSTRFTADDFPSLRLSVDAEHNYAQVLQATIELTQLLHNAHDILYSSKERRMQMVHWGDYNRYLDDFRRSLSAWHDRWGKLDASPKLYSTLRIVKEYVRLYVCAFSFQSILSRAVQENRNHDTIKSPPGKASSLFPQGIMSTPDGVCVFEAVDSAQKILMISTETDPVAHIRYMPFRFYVYTIYSAVFLYKAAAFGAFSPSQHKDIVELVHRFIHILEQAATSDSHIGYRYSKLLKRIWLSNASNSVEHEGDNLAPQKSHQGALFPIVGEPVDYSNGSRNPTNPDIQAPVSMEMLTPDFNLFCPDFSSLESEFFDISAGQLWVSNQL